MRHAFFSICCIAGLTVTANAQAQATPLVPAPQSPNPPMKYAGIVITTLGTLSTTFGATMVFYGATMTCTHEGRDGCPDRTLIPLFGLPFALSGGALLGLGIPLWVNGGVSDDEPVTVQLSPTGGELTLRF